MFGRKPACVARRPRMRKVYLSGAEDAFTSLRGCFTRSVCPAAARCARRRQCGGSHAACRIPFLRCKRQTACSAFAAENSRQAPPTPHGQAYPDSYSLGGFTYDDRNHQRKPERTPFQKRQVSEDRRRGQIPPVRRQNHGDPRAGESSSTANTARWIPCSHTRILQSWSRLWRLATSRSPCTS